MKNIIRRLAAVLTAVLLLSCSLSALAADPVSTRGEYAEIIVESFFSGDADAAYKTTFGMSRPEFDSVYNEALGYLEGEEDYHLIFADTFETVVSGALTEAAIYVLETDAGVFEVDIALDGMYNKVGLISVYPAGDGWLDADKFDRYVTVASSEDEPGEPTRRGFHYTPMSHATETFGISRIMLVYSGAVIIFIIAVLIDCIRKHIAQKWVWIILILLGEGYVFSMLIPVGAIIYLCLRKKLIKNYPDK